jgi:hypothetical protein
MSAWIDQMFGARQVNKGGLVRRSRADIDKYASIGEVIAEAKRRSSHVIESGDQVIVLCNEDGLVIHC